MANGTPRQNIHNVEPNRVVGLEKAHVLLCPRIPCFKVRLSILRRHLFGHVFSLEVEEHEPAQKQGQPCAQTDHYGCTQLSFNPAVELLLGGNRAAESSPVEGICGLVEGSEALESWCREQSGSHDSETL